MTLLFYTVSLLVGLLSLLVFNYCFVLHCLSIGLYCYPVSLLVAGLIFFLDNEES